MIISFTNTITSSALYHWMVSPNGQGIITLLAFIILVIYTWSTIRLWKESKKQTELLSAPSIIIEEDRKNKTFMATNIGKGVALNVQLSRIRMYIIDIPREPLCLEFNEIDILKPNETKSFDVNKREGSEFIKHAVLPGKHTDKNYRFNLEFMDSNGKTYRTLFYSGKNGLKIKNIGRFTLFSKIYYFIFEYSEAVCVQLSMFIKRIKWNREHSQKSDNDNN